jgi:regulator of protease activity HflC (stomatin/prohibitin superfamily)
LLIGYSIISKPVIFLKGFILPFIVMVDEEISKGKTVLSSAGRIAKKTARASILAGLILTPVISISSLMAKWTYQVRTNHGVVVTKWDGKREAVTDVGWHWRTPFLSTYENEFPLANQAIYYEGNPDPRQIVTKDDKILMVSAVAMMEIPDLKKYAIDNVQEETGLLDPGPGKTGKVNTRVMIQKTLDSIIGGYLQTSEADVLLHDRWSVEKKIKQAINNSAITKMYGGKLNDFSFPVVNYVPGEVDARANKQAMVVNAEAKKAASDLEKQALVKLGEAEADIYKNIRDTLKPKNATDEKRVDAIFDKILKYRTMKNKPGSMILMDGSGVSPIYDVK